MQATRIVIPEKRRSEIQTFEVGKPKPGELLMQTQYSLISPGTEMSFYAGHHSRLQQSDTPPNAWARYPFYPGFSLGGIVQQVGQGCTLKPGQKVMAHHPHVSACCLDQGRVTVVPDEVSLEDATFLELAAISLNGVRRANIQLGDAVVVMGAGLVGLLAISMAQMDGASMIIVLDPDIQRQKLALKYGATHAFNPLNCECDQTIKQLTQGWGADVVIEASGNINAIVMGLGLTRQCGRMVLLGCQHGEIMFSFYEGIQSRSITVIGAHINSSPNTAQTGVFHQTKQRDFQLIFQMIGKKQLKVSEWITHRITTDQVDQMYDAIDKRTCSTLGIIVNWA